MTAHHDPNDTHELRQQEHEQEQEVRQLIERAGRRPQPAEEDLAAIKTAFRDAWRRQVAEPSTAEAAPSAPTPLASRRPPAAVADVRQGRRPGRRAAWTLLAAASLLLAITLAWWGRSGEPAAPAGPVVATAEAVTGTTSDGAPVDAGQPLRAGSLVETDDDGHGALRLSSGVALRIAAGSRVRLAASGVLDLERGALYVDTDGALSGKATAGQATAGGTARSAVEIRTALGNARDIGTRFEVRMLDGGPAGLRVRVRDGEVRVQLDGEGGTYTGTYTAAGGSQLTVRADGEIERQPIAAYGDDWAWTAAAAPSLDVDGRTVREVLDWAAHESGLELHFDSAATEAAAASAIVHGTIPRLTPDRAPALVLPSAGLGYRVVDGVLRVAEFRSSN
jgi:hypothetical protein